MKLNMSSHIDFIALFQIVIVFLFFTALRSKEKVETKPYRIKAKDGSFVHIKSKLFRFKNPWTKEVEHIVSTNTVLP